MKLKKLDGSGHTRWVDYLWMPALAADSDPGLREAMRTVAEGLVALWAKNVWTPGQSRGSGNVFPVTLNSLQRVHSEPGEVQVGYAVSGGSICAAVLLHLGKAIGPYADRTMSWAEQQFRTRNVAFVRSLCVSDSFRGYGIGREMLVQARQRARALDASALVSHLRVRPDRDARLATAYADAGFDRTGEEQTVTIRMTVENQWRELCGREEPAPIEWLPASEQIDLHFVPVAASITNPVTAAAA